MALGKKGKADGRVKPIENQITHIVRAFSELHYNQRKKNSETFSNGAK